MRTMPRIVTRLASQIPAAIEGKLKDLGQVVAPQQTAALYAPLARPEPFANVRVERDLAYGPDGRHRLDVFAPVDNSGSRPVLVFVHGGAFTGGHKRIGDSPFYDNIALWAVAAGMIGVNMTYRLAPGHPWPDAQRDVAQAVSWVRDNIEAREGDTSRIFLMGHSAGAAHVAQYVAHPEFHSAPLGGIAGTIMVSGIFDSVTADRNTPFQSYFGSNPSLYADRSALPGLVASSLPMMFAYAELDPPDFQRQMEQVFVALRDAGKSPQAYLLQGHSHMSEVYSIHTEDHALVNRVQDFVERRR